jgi:repressor of nif and glnA expression
MNLVDEITLVFKNHNKPLTAKFIYEELRKKGLKILVSISLMS